ncbi:MAG: hypothetical protein HFF07_02885 [Oscillospiraceae bacterium]|nr:hypothetical protein [Oscillospiraceae bacterium]
MAQAIGETIFDVLYLCFALAAGLTFGFYLPVVLFSGVAPAVGMLMIPKTLAYVWVVWMGWGLHRQTRG